LPAEVRRGEQVAITGLRESDCTLQFHWDTYDGKRLAVEGVVVTVPSDATAGRHQVFVRDRPFLAVDIGRGHAWVTVTKS
jgi:hypothetical protein